MNIDKKLEKKLIRKLQKQFDCKQVYYTFNNDTVTVSGLYPFFVNFMSLPG